MRSVFVAIRNFSRTSCSRKEAVRSAKGRKMGSTQWLSRQINDPFVKLASSENYRCRSAFKLSEIHEKFNIFHPGFTVIDCGAAPGSWTQVAVQNTNADRKHKDCKVGKVIAVDLQHMAQVDGAIVLGSSDFTSPEVQGKIMSILDNAYVDCVISDMAPNATGLRTADHDNIVKLVLSALKFSFVVLKDNGTFLCKLFHGAQEPSLKAMLESCFKDVKIIRPKASRKDSSELFYLCRGFKRNAKNVEEKNK